MYNDAITVYNLCDGVWRGHDLRADVGEAYGVRNSTRGDSGTDRITVLLNTAADRSVKTVDGAMLQYYEAKAYAAHSGAGYTLSHPSFVIVGNHTAPHTATDDDYDEGFYSYCNAHYDGVYRITTASWYGLIPHFEFGGA